MNNSDSSSKENPRPAPDIQAMLLELSAEAKELIANPNLPQWVRERLAQAIGAKREKKDAGGVS